MKVIEEKGMQRGKIREGRLDERERARVLQSWKLNSLPYPVGTVVCAAFYVQASPNSCSLFSGVAAADQRHDVRISIL